jgi:nicotinamidase-related amidase
VQQGFEDQKWGERNNMHAEENIYTLLQAWRQKGWPVIHVQHLSESTNSPLFKHSVGIAFKEIVKSQEGELIIQKNVNSAFIGTNLEQHLKGNGIQTLVITGLTTPHCVSTTARMSGNLGFATYIVSDATAAFAIKGPDGINYSADEIHNISLATLHKEFAVVVSTEELVNEIV